MRNFFFVLYVICAIIAVQSYRVTSQNGIAQCPTVCPAIYQPVCAKNLRNPSQRPRIFGNACEMNVFNCQNDAEYVAVNMNRCAHGLVHGGGSYPLY